MIFLYDNLLDSATLTASSAATGFPGANVQNPFRSKVWRTAGALAGVAQLVIDHGSAKAVNCIAMTGYSWLTAPGKLVVEFNDTDAWTNPAATETLTWNAPTTPGGNKGSIILKMSSTRTYRYNRLRVVAASGVTLTAAGSGSSGITVADNANSDVGTGNFALAWKGSLPDWTPVADQTLLYKVSGAAVDYNGFVLYASSGGKLFLSLYRDSVSVTFQSTVVHGIVDGSVARLAVVVVRETAGVAGSITFYVNGVQLGAPVAITVAATITLDNSSPLYVMGTAAVRTAGTCSFAAVFNRNLTAAEVLSLDNSGTAPLIAYADKWGSQTAVYTSDFSAGTYSWLAVRAGINGNIDGIGGQDNNLRFYADNVNDTHSVYGSVGTALVGKNIKVTLDYYIPSANTNVKRISPFIANSQVAGDNVGSTLDAWTSVTITGLLSNTSERVFIAMGSATAWSFVGANVNTNDLIYVRNIKVYPEGATLALEAEGINATDWQDSSTNNLDGTYPVAGCTVNGASDWDLGRLFVGEYFQPAKKYGWGYSEGVVDPSLLSQTIGGQDHVDAVEMFRVIRVNGILLSQAQWVLYQDMINTVGTRKPLFIAFDYTGEAAERTIYGKFSQVPKITRPYFLEYDFEFTEDR